MTIKYRPEIDGLRTIAVLSVIIYHAEFILAGRNILPGGFFGVDVFFVISGFLITSLLMNQLYESGGVSILNFYERRARRLLPALLAVMLVSIVTAINILLPAQLVDFSKSLLASLFFVSNFYWDMSLQEYGAESALLKPFLHTWSLAVEEQYYIVFPLILLAIHKYLRRHLKLLLVAGMLISLAFAVWFTSANAHSSFYMLSSRFWELLAGGLLAVNVHQGVHQRSPGMLDRLMPTLGLLLLFYSFIFIEYSNNHPGLVTLLPVIGTVLIILFSKKEALITNFLASRPMVAIGLISYSLYLWHYPIFAFARNIRIDISLNEKLICIVLTFLFSTISYFLVEKPARNRQKIRTRWLMSILLSLTLVITLFSVYAIQKNGLRDRFSELDILYGINEFDNTILQDRSWSILNGLAAEKGYEESRHNTASKFESEALWFSSSSKVKKVLIIGNSVSKDLFNAFYQNADKFPDHEFGRFGMGSKFRNEHLSQLMTAPNFSHADIVIVSLQISSPKAVERISRFVERLKASGKQVLVSSTRLSFIGWGGRTLFDYSILNNDETEFSELELSETFYKGRKLGLREEANTDLRNLAQRLDVSFLDMWNLVCDKDKKTCDAATPDGYKAYYDTLHWTLEGAKHFGERIPELGWLETH